MTPVISVKNLQKNFKNKVQIRNAIRRYLMGYEISRDEKVKTKIDTKKKPITTKDDKHIVLRFGDLKKNGNYTISIGREPGNDVVIKDDPLISRKHAIIEKSGKKYFIMDKGSQNGVIVNKKQIDPMIINIPIVSFIAIISIAFRVFS